MPSPPPLPPTATTRKRHRRRFVGGAGAAALCLLGLAVQLVLSTTSRQRWMGEWDTGSDHATPLESMTFLRSVPVIVARNDTSSYGESSLPGSVVRQSLNTIHPQDNRSTLVIHIGPPKVGSTYIQCSLCGADNQRNDKEDRSLARFLAMDSYVFLGTCPWRVCGLEREPDWGTVLQHRLETFMTRNLGLSHLVGPQVWTGRPVPASAADVQNNRTNTIQPEVLRRLDDLQNRGLNGLLVYEGLSVFDPLWVAQLSGYLRRKNWKVTIIVAYRPLFAWLPSKYNSLTKVGKNPAVRYWPDDPICRTLLSGCHGIEPFSLRPASSKGKGGRGGGRRTDKFELYVAQLEATQIHPAHACYTNYAQHFDDVRILPLHRLAPESSSSPQGGKVDPMLEYLFCTAMDGTPTACRAIRGRAHSETASRNPSDPSQEYDRLAMFAHQQGYFNRSRMWNVSRSDLRTWAEDFHRINLSNSPLPRNCLDPSELDRLERLSWQMEQNLFGNASGTSEHGFQGGDWANEARHHEEFQRAVQKQQAYCWVDANRTLREDPRWQAFFESPFDPTTLGDPPQISS